MDNLFDTKELLSVRNMEDKDIDDLISKLSPKEKAELVQKLLGQQSGLMVVMGGSNVTTSEIVIQIHSNSGIDISDILKAVAGRIINKDLPKKPEEGALVSA
jgi:hypothetical protein